MTLVQVGEGEGRSEEGRPSAHGEARPPTGAEWAPMDLALRCYRGGDADATLLMRTDVGGVEEVPVALFFRSTDRMGAVERVAMDRVRGSVLDLGAGPGAHAIPLRAGGFGVTAVEVLPEARAALREGGVEDVRAGGLDALGADERFDTVLVLMNGVGLAGSLDSLGDFLVALSAHITGSGQILTDSTDPRGWEDPGDGRYPGEVHMQLGFQGSWGDPFPFLFVDAELLAQTARPLGLDVTVVAEEEDGRYLAVITRGPLPPTS